MTLFELGNFTLHSGEKSSWKIECDNLTDIEIRILAHELAQIVKPFIIAIPVPNGGNKLAKAMDSYANPNSSGILVVDDVYTTGNSIRKVMQIYQATQGAVLFARKPITQARIVALWQMQIPYKEPVKQPRKDAPPVFLAAKKLRNNNFLS